MPGGVGAGGEKPPATRLCQFNFQVFTEEREIIMPSSDLTSLAEKWENSAKNRFLAAGQEKDDFGKRFIEHGAMCYFNCAQELKKILISSSLPPSTTQLES